MLLYQIISSCSLLYSLQWDEDPHHSTKTALVEVTSNVHAAKPTCQRPGQYHWTWLLPSSSVERFAHMVFGPPHTSSFPPTSWPFLLILLHLLLLMSPTSSYWRVQGSPGRFLLSMPHSPSDSFIPADLNHPLMSPRFLSPVEALSELQTPSSQCQVSTWMSPRHNHY